MSVPRELPNHQSIWVRVSQCPYGFVGRWLMGSVGGGLGGGVVGGNLHVQRGVLGWRQTPMLGKGLKRARVWGVLVLSGVCGMYAGEEVELLWSLKGCLGGG